MAKACETPLQTSIETLLDGRFRRPLMSFFMRRVGSASEAEDLTQDVFVRILAAAEREDVQNVEALVFVTAGNLLKDRERSRRRKPRTNMSELDDKVMRELHGELVESRTPERIYLGRQSLNDIIRVLNELGDRTRDIFILFRLENMKQKEIAGLFGISVSTVEKEVMRATVKLAMRLRRENI